MFSGLLYVTGGPLLGIFMVGLLIPRANSKVNIHLSIFIYLFLRLFSIPYNSPGKPRFSSNRNKDMFSAGQLCAKTRSARVLSPSHLLRLNFLNYFLFRSRPNLLAVRIRTTLVRSVGKQNSHQLQVSDLNNDCRRGSILVSTVLWK